MRIIIGYDKNGLELKEHILKFLREEGYAADDVQEYMEEGHEYPDIAFCVANMIKEKRYDRGILICGTGIGMSIAANKVPGVYAAVCHDTYSTERSILSNNIQIMCMGALVIGKATALSLVEKWLQLSFVDSPSTDKINSIKQREKENFPLR